MPSKDVDRELIEVATSLERAAEYFKSGQFEDAEPIYRNALSVLERVYGAGDPDTLSALQSLGDLYFKMERYKEAVPLYRRLVIIGEKALGKQHPGVIEMVMRLAMTYEKLGLAADAESMYKRANQVTDSSLAAVKQPIPEENASSTTNKSFAEARSHQRG